jgi:general stress protein 26
MVGAELATFLEQGVGIHIGTRDENLRPNGARAVAAKVEEAGSHLVIYVSEIAATRVRADLESNGQVAVVFGRPEDERSCQVKGVFVSIRPATDEERPLLQKQWNGFLDQLEKIGIPRVSAANWITWPAVAIRMKVTTIFEQTPGPRAGAQIA